MRGGEEKNVQIQVKMFGEFSITINGNTLTDFKGNTKRVWILIQYLLANRFEAVSIDRLVTKLWSGNQCGDPKNALKNLVYRARVLLKDLSGDENLQFILFVNDTYQWNNRYSCELDTEQFMKFYRKGENLSLMADARVSAYQKAIALYRGNFLEKSSFSGWVVGEANRYAGIYRACAEKVCAIYFDFQKYDEAAAVCRKALEWIPYEVPVHRLLLQSYINMGKRKEASGYLESTKDLFNRKFGVDIMATLQPVYKELIHNSNNVETDLTRIQSDLRESENVQGAYFCDYDTFRIIYRLLFRLYKRTGLSAYLVLFSLVDRSGSFLQRDDSNRIAEKFSSAIVNSLRRTDIVAPYNFCQFIVMMPLASFQDAEHITQRIEKNFRFSCRREDVRLLSTFSPLE